MSKVNKKEKKQNGMEVEASRRMKTGEDFDPAEVGDRQECKKPRGKGNPEEKQNRQNMEEKRKERTKRSDEAKNGKKDKKSDGQDDGADEKGEPKHKTIEKTHRKDKKEDNNKAKRKEPKAEIDQGEDKPNGGNWLKDAGAKSTTTDEEKGKNTIGESPATKTGNITKTDKKGTTRTKTSTKATRSDGNKGISHNMDDGLPIPESKISKDGKEITIDAVFHPTDPNLKPDVLDTEKLASLIHADPNFWSKEQKPLSRIAADFGRSHYIFTNGTIEIPFNVHKFCYQNEGPPPSGSERVEFFNRLGLKGSSIPAVFDTNTPQRGCGLTRVKYELVRKYLADNGFEKNCERLAVHALYLSTQDYLSWVKICSEAVLKRHFPELKVAFAFFQSSVVCSSGKAFLQISLANHIPTSDAWQCKFILPTDNKRNIKAVFMINLEEGNTDLGQLTVTLDTKKKHKFYKVKKISQKTQESIFGIYDADKSHVIKYCDTLPTW